MNIRLILAPEQLAIPTCAITTEHPVLNNTTISEHIDQSQIMVVILTHLPQDTFSQTILAALDRVALPKGWTSQSGLLRFND